MDGSGIVIQLITNHEDNTVYTTWILKLNVDLTKRKTKSGQIKTYSSYFISFPQELYEFLDIENDNIYLIKDLSNKYDVIVSDTPPTLPVNYVKSKLIIRRKNQNRKNRIPTTSFTLSRKIFNGLDDAKEVKFILDPKSNDRYRNKLGVIYIKLIQ